MWRAHSNVMPTRILFILPIFILLSLLSTGCFPTPVSKIVITDSSKKPVADTIVMLHSINKGHPPTIASSTPSTSEGIAHFKPEQKIYNSYFVSVQTPRFRSLISSSNFRFEQPNTLYLENIDQFTAPYLSASLNDIPIFNLSDSEVITEGCSRVE